MADFNMPPGVSVNDIPGNRPEDLAEDEFWNALENDLQERYNLDIEDEFWNADWFRTAISSAHRLAFHAGYGQGQTDAYMEISQRELDG